MNCKCITMNGNSDINNTNEKSQCKEKFNEHIKIIQEYKMSPCTDNQYVNNKNKCNYVENYDLQRAEKFLSKRKTNVKYDDDVVYGKPSKVEANSHKQNVSNVNASTHDTKTNDDNKQLKDIRKESINDSNKETLNITTQNNNNNKDNNLNNSNDIAFKTNNKLKAIPKEDNTIQLNNNHHTHSNNKTFKNIKHKHKLTQVNNKNVDPLLSDNNSSPVKSNHHHSNSQPIMFPNSNNKNFELLFSNNNINEPTIDIFPCMNCEPIYRLCILNNIPLKTLQCLVCGNIINKNSLNFYIKKYHKQILKDTNESININDNWFKWLSSQQQKIKEDKLYKHNQKPFLKDK